jgi:hypothetical protein
MEREENEKESTNERTRMASADERMAVAACRENRNVARTRENSGRAHRREGPRMTKPMAVLERIQMTTMWKVRRGRMVWYGRDPLRSCVEEISSGNPVEKHGERARKATTMEV